MPSSTPKAPLVPNTQPIKTGLVGVVGYDVIGNTSEDIQILGENLSEKEDPLSKILGGAFELLGEMGLFVGDTLIGETVGDLVVSVGTTVKNIGSNSKLKNAGPFGNLLGGVLETVGETVNVVGGDDLSTIPKI